MGKQQQRRWGGSRVEGGVGVGWASSEQKAQNEQAIMDGRVVYIRGIPPDWKVETLTDFFKNHGEVESVNLMPQKKGQNARAAFVNFTESDAANQAAEVCDNLPIEPTDGSTSNFRLVCSIKKSEQKVDMVSGFTDLSKARQEKRSVYISGLPNDFDKAKVKELVSPYGVVEGVKILPAARNVSCFAMMTTAEEATQVIEALDGKEVNSKRISVTFPRPPKRTRGNEAGDVVVEIRGFPDQALPTEVSSVVETQVKGVEVLTVKMLRHESLMGQSIAHVIVKNLQDADAVIKEMEGFELSPGVRLQAQLRPDQQQALGWKQQQPAHLQNRDDDEEPAAKRRALTQGAVLGIQRRVPGNIVGVLREDGPALRKAAESPAAAEDDAVAEPVPAKIEKDPADEDEEQLWEEEDPVEREDQEWRTTRWETPQRDAAPWTRWDNEDTEQRDTAPWSRWDTEDTEQQDAAPWSRRPLPTPPSMPPPGMEMPPGRPSAARSAKPSAAPSSGPSSAYKRERDESSGPNSAYKRDAKWA